jgi:hypothetical protein
MYSGGAESLEIASIKQSRCLFVRTRRTEGKTAVIETDPQALVRPDNTLYRKASDFSSEMPLQTSKLDIHGLFLSRLIFFCQSNQAVKFYPETRHQGRNMP